MSAHYVVRVMTGQEEEVMQEINKLDIPDIIKAYNPQSVFGNPVFPGYVFVKTKLTGKVYYAIRNLPGVLYFLSPTYGVFPISEEEAISLKQEEYSLIGTSVIITRGRYRGIACTVHDVNFPVVTVNLPLGVRINVNIKSLASNDAPLCGSAVRILSGTYAGLVGTVEEVSGPMSLVKSLVLGMDVLIECPVKHLERY